MSLNSNEKIKRLESLEPREQSVLLYIMQDKHTKVKDICDRLGLADQTIRAVITSIYKKLGVPEALNPNEKRSYLDKEYGQIFKDRYLRISKRPTSSLNNWQERDRLERVEGEIVDEGRDSPPKANRPKDEPTIVIMPPERKVNPSLAITGVLGGFLLISICVIGVLVGLIFTLNRPQPIAATSIPQAAAIQEAQPQNTATPQAVVIMPTATFEPTPIPVASDTQPPPTPLPTHTPAMTATPKAFYNQGEGAVLREGVFISLDSDFFNTVWHGCEYNPGFKVQFVVTNKRSEEFLMRYDRFAFEAVDNTGKSYELKASGWGYCENTPGGITTSILSNRQGWFILSFFGEIPLEARYIDITVLDISGSGRIVFRKDL